MVCSIRIVLEGLPERVQELANTLDEALPDGFEWHDFADPSDGEHIVLRGSSSRQVKGTRDHGVSTSMETSA